MKHDNYIVETLCVVLLNHAESSSVCVSSRLKFVCTLIIVFANAVQINLLIRGYYTITFLLELPHVGNI